MELKDLERKVTCVACGVELLKGDKAISFKSAKNNAVSINLCESCCNSIKNEMLANEPKVEVVDSAVEMQLSSRIKINN